MIGTVLLTKVKQLDVTYSYSPASRQTFKSTSIQVQSTKTQQESLHNSILKHHETSEKSQLELLKKRIFPPIAFCSTHLSTRQPLWPSPRYYQSHAEKEECQDNDKTCTSLESLMRIKMSVLSRFVFPHPKEIYIYIYNFPK